MTTQEINFQRVAAVADNLLHYADMLYTGAKQSELDEEALDGLARTLKRLEELGVKPEILD